MDLKELFKEREEILKEMVHISKSKEKDREQLLFLNELEYKDIVNRIRTHPKLLDYMFPPVVYA